MTYPCIFETLSCHFETFSYHCAVVRNPPCAMETVTQALSNRIVELEGAGFELPAGVMSNLKESLKDQSGATSAQTILSLKDADHLRELKTVEGQKTQTSNTIPMFIMFSHQQDCFMRWQVCEGVHRGKTNRHQSDVW